MNRKLALQSISGIAVAGMLFSGYLSYTELAKQTCAFGGCSYVLGAPACVYGLVMYACVFVLSVIGVRAKK